MIILALTFAGACGAKASDCHVRQVQQIVQQPYAVVEKVQFLAVEKDPYNVQVVGEQIRQRQRAEALAQEQAGLVGEVQALRNELYELRRLLTGQGVAPAPVAPAPATIPPPTPITPPPPVPELPAPAEEGAITLSPWAVGLLADRCASCHNPNKASAGFVLFDKDLSTPILSAGKLVMIDQVIYSNEMPKAPKAKLVPEEYNKLRAEFDKFTQQIRAVIRDADR